MQVELSFVLQILTEIRGQLQLEANQSILRKDHAQGMAALGGIDALLRFENRIKFSAGLPAQFPAANYPSSVRPLRGKLR